MSLNEVLEEAINRPLRAPPKLRLITGGKGPTEPDSDDWLTPLPKGTAFSCRKINDKTEDLSLLIVTFKHDKTIVLADGLQLSPPRAVDPKIFSRRYTLIEIIAEEGGERPKVEHDNERQTNSDGELGREDTVPEA